MPFTASREQHAAQPGTTAIRQPASRAQDAGLDVIQTEGLVRFDGQAGISAGQGA